MAELSERHEVRVRGTDNTVVFLVRDTSLADVAKCALISCDSNMRSNVSVGPPIDLLIYRRNALAKPFRDAARGRASLSAGESTRVGAATFPAGVSSGRVPVHCRA